MRFYSETLGISESEFIILRNLIHEKTGIFFENGKRETLADKISPFLIERGFSSFLDYYYLLRYDENADDEWSRLMDVITVPETFFWREPDQIHALSKVLMPEFVASKGGEPIRIVSIPCSSGEEPLTIAISLLEEGWFDRTSVEIYAGDISQRAIKRAQNGLYREFSFRNMKPEMRDKYFTKQEGGWRISPSVSSKIIFDVTNLFDESYYERIDMAHIIFCRNVFIYFSTDAIQRALKIFYRRLKTPGYLCTGASESLLKVTNDFELTDINGALIYKKR